MYVSSKNLEQITYTNKFITKNSAKVETLPCGYLIIAKQRETIETSCYPERLEVHRQTSNNRSIF